LNEALLFVEEEGFKQGDHSDRGDFDDFGDEAANLDFRDELEDYHWEYWVSEVDLSLAGDIAGMAQELQGSGEFGSSGEGGPDMSSVGGGGSNPLAAIGMNSQVITEMLTPYIREVRVRVWWGKDSAEAEDRGDEVVVVTHLVNPTGVVSLGEEAPE
jgi:hypothetical protein